MEETNERIRLLIKKLGLPTTAKFCRDVGLSRPLVDKLMSSGGNQPRFDTLQKIKNAFPKTNLNWLVSGKGEILEDEKDKKDFDLLNIYRNIKIKNSSNLTNSFITSMEYISKEYHEMEQMELNAKAQLTNEKKLILLKKDLLFYQYQRRLVSESLKQISSQNSLLTELYKVERLKELKKLIEDVQQKIMNTINLFTEDNAINTENNIPKKSTGKYEDEIL